MEQRKVSGLGTILLLTGLFCLLLTNHSWGSNQQTSSAEEGTEVMVTGELTVLSVDDFDRGSAEVLYHLKDSKSGKVFNLHFSGEPSVKLRTGSIVTVRGKAKGQDIYLMADTGGAQLQEVVSSAPAVVGEQKTIVIVANFLDAIVACPVLDIQDRVFTDPLNKSVDDLYQEMSFEQLWFNGSVVGPFTINYSTTSSCDLGAWTVAADAAASASGINLSTYNRRIYVLPRTNPCGYSGVGTLGGNPSRSWIFKCDGSDAFAHELGHNLGMHHAATPTEEYGDTSDIMGYGGFGLRQVNGPHQDQMGWLDPVQIKGVVTSGTYTIAPIEDSPSQAIDPQILIIAKPDTGESYYLSYRQALGFDASLSQIYLKGVNIHRYKTDTATQTYLLSVLADGQSFTDTINGATITQLGHTSEYVIVQIQLDYTPCTANPPILSVAPASQSAFGGSPLSYSVSVTNMDSVNCQQAPFSLAASVPSGWTGSLSPTTLTLAPGAVGSATVTVSSPVSAAATDYPVIVNVSDAAAQVHTTSRTATYTVMPKSVCIPGTPRVSISPNTQSGQKGSTLYYTISVANKDSGDCSQTTFSLSRTVPAGWTGTVSPATLTLLPGASKSATLSVTPATTAAAGYYGITVAVSDGIASTHTSTVNGVYSVVEDTMPPTAPTNFTASAASRKVNMSWTASSDNVGVAGYKVWRNNNVVGQTTGTAYTDATVTTRQTYTYYVTAFDATGNSSVASNRVTVTVTGVGRKK
jgi:hypothetical protein